MDNDELYLYDILTPYDWFIWTTFHDNYPHWLLDSYGTRPVIKTKSGTCIIEARTLELAIKRAKEWLREENLRKQYYSCPYCGRYY